MVCQRCITAVKAEMEAVGLSPDQVMLGEVVFSAELTGNQARQLEERLQPYGFTVLEDKRIKLVNEIRGLVDRVYGGDYDFPERFRFSELASSKLATAYETLSAVFATQEKKTLERFIIDYRVEKIKEFLVYSNDTLSDIAFRLGFSSVAHLSRQFKENTGLNPSYFRERNAGIRA